MTTIEVTREDIERGQRCSGRRCMIALALARHIRPGAEFFVGLADTEGEVWFSKDGWHQCLDRVLPPEAFEAAVRFDDRLPVAPFAFDLDIPAELLKEATP